MGRPKKVKEFEPEVVGEGVTREEPIENPNDILPEPPVQGNWRKCTYDELVKHESSGRLVGFKPDTMEVLLKE